MNRSILAIIAVSLALGGCSGKSKPAEAEKKAAAPAKGGKPAHVNPWAVDTPSEPAPAAPPKKAAPKAKETPKPGPWDKDQPAATAPAAKGK